MDDLLAETTMKPRVLVVEDDKTYHVVIEHGLVKDGYDLVCVDSYRGALEALESSTFDLVIADKNLEDGTGLELAQKISASGADTQVILISAYATLDSALEAIRLEVADFFIKPLGLADFRARVRRVVEVQAIRRQNELLVRELRKKNEVLQSLAVRDPLTGLFNHVHLKETVEREIYRAQRHSMDLSAVFIDLDKFKAINDTLGHQTGDKVLKEFSNLVSNDGGDAPFRLRTEDIVARYGGDEFVLLLPNTNKAGATAKAEQLRSIVETRALGVPEVSVITASIGVASYPEDGDDRNALLDAADAAMYVAKETGGNAVVSYVPEMKDAATAHSPRVSVEMERINALRRTIDDCAFSYVYQPIIDCQKNAAIGYEIFCRPQDEVFSNPSTLFTTAERAGRIVELGRILRRQFSRAVSAVPESCLLFINIHPLELFDSDLLAGETELTPLAHRIVLEVTDTTAISNLKRAQKSIELLHSQGFRIGLDEIGPGYGGLNNILQLSPDFVKLNAVILENVSPDSRSGRLIKHIFECSREEGIEVIVEGIETEEQKHTAAQFGGLLMQGYLFARPDAKP